MKDLPVLLDRLEEAGGPPDPVPSADGWELVLAENVAYLVGDQRRWRAVAELRSVVGLAPEQILAAPDAMLRDIVAGARPAERVQRLRRCAELAIGGVPWSAYPGIDGLGKTASTSSPGPAPSWLWTPTAFGYSPGWATAKHRVPTRPATGRSRPQRTHCCPRRCPPASVLTSCCAATDKPSAAARTLPARSVPSPTPAQAPATPRRCTEALLPISRRLLPQLALAVA